MKGIYKEFLFNKHILVSEGQVDPQYAFSTLVALANKFAIRITKGHVNATLDMVRTAADILGEYVPEPFYRGFPQTVRELTSDQLLYDQLLHYTYTYGLGWFEDPGHSVFEENFERMSFIEQVTPKDFTILTENEAVLALTEYINGYMTSSRPLSQDAYMLVKEAITDYDIKIDNITCKQTAVKLLYDFKNVPKFAKFINLSDVIKLVEYINYSQYNNENIKKLNLKNQDRKLIERVINYCFEHGRDDIKTAFEKRRIWCGLLHHIHFKPTRVEAKQFANYIREGINLSVYSDTEELLRRGYVVQAATVLVNTKGTSVLLRNLNYLLSRCKDEDDIKGVLACLE